MNPAPSSLQSGMQRQKSRDASDPLAEPPSVKQTAVPPPRMSILLGGPSSFSRSEYVDTPVVDDEPISVPIKKAGAPVASKQKAVAKKETPVPLPSWMPQQAAKSQLPNKVPATTAPVGRPTTTTQSASVPQTPGSSKRGRPRGWKPGMSYAAIRGNTPPGSRSHKKTKPPTINADGTVKRRGRPPKQLSPSPADIYYLQDAHFINFLCEWAGCQAELQNLDTLRRHIDIVHLKAQKPEQASGLRCYWGKCKQAPGTAHDEHNEGERFAGPKELEAHVEESHLVPFSWHIGDGPRNFSGLSKLTGKKHREDDDSSGNTEDDDDVPDYLKDADGNQVTPSIKGQVVEDYVTWRANRKKLRQRLLERDMNLPSEDEDSRMGDDEEGDADEQARV